MVYCCYTHIISSKGSIWWPNVGDPKGQVGDVAKVWLPSRQTWGRNWASNESPGTRNIGMLYYIQKTYCDRSDRLHKPKVVSGNYLCGKQEKLCISNQGMPWLVFGGFGTRRQDETGLSENGVRQKTMLDYWLSCSPLELQLVESPIFQINHRRGPWLLDLDSDPVMHRTTDGEMPHLVYNMYIYTV